MARSPLTRKRSLVLKFATLAVVMTVSACASPSASGTAPPLSTSNGAIAAGSYVKYADYLAKRAAYSAHRVVLFFHAPWCPDCTKTEANLKADPRSIPSDLTIVEVDFDSATDLKSQYGVTQQWTFVSIDAAGAKLKAFTGTYTGAEISAQAK